MTGKAVNTKTATTIIGTLLCIILLPVLLFNSILIVKATISPNEIPMFCGIAPFIVLSGSMENEETEPNIRSGDLIFVTKTDTGALRERDIIAFQEGQSVITHRIKRIEETDGKREFITQGDNPLNGEDVNPVSEENVVGVYTFKIGKLGDLAMFLQTPIGIMSFVGIPFILLIVFDIVSRRFSRRKDNEEKTHMEEEINRLRNLVGEEEEK